jgi:Polysaccharide pyruvyl transferase
VRVLVTGWFSFEDAEVTAGDLLARDTVAGWLRQAAIPHDAAVASTFRQPAELDLRAAEPSAYSHLLFVCGPAAGAPVEELFARFAGCQRIAVGVSVVDRTGDVPADRVLARDAGGTSGTDRTARSAPDLSLASPTRDRPVVGVIRSHLQPEYGDRHRLAEAHAAVDRLLLHADVAPVSVDTWLHPGRPDICSTPAQVESVLSRLDAVVTTRLHGLVLALKVGVPALAVDAVAGGGKVSRQAAALDWAAIVGVEATDDQAMRQKLDWCLSARAREEAAHRAANGRRGLGRVRDELLGLLERATR